ncbi:MULTISPECIES: 2-dehydro-3-deoxy-6-phosphogalactonate aldolase [Pacificibacter]|uniref:2-dehydro-3-deoxy-6-phosphogalactonate aldolase n=1 Tax=Pacificibacter TaxID=1042323 RepID=UPI001C0A5871|nr:MULTISPECIES: 2-dehydro-3-deoxy-6-phosphogalactonate aldolase [Pacificibacter]MBU2935489.1 2-dehydro-3-deoxy-6-phosphogalactonate aldolase [Pacificibacter marinus]MDO6613986.1 2-dehydro-3-deoxy-6-phosphogalactonate aldolase [Pacificibacter sp. 1_MG-2023]
MSRNIIAILRGVQPSEVHAIAQTLIAQGIDKIEVPLNSPDPFTSIETLVTKFQGQGTFGAGTVLTTEDVTRLADIGAQMIVSPNCHPEVIKATKAAGMLSFPGVMTPSECFAALDAGADALKFFPGELVGPVGLRAMRAVLPKDIDCFAVGGAKAENFGAWVQAGATGFGIGSALYRVGDTAADVAQKAADMVQAYDAVFS